jgi:type IV pilus assembly PilO-like protein
MRQRLDQRVIIAGAAVGLLLFALLGYLLLISPQRSKAGRLDNQINETQAAIDQNRLLRANKVETVRVADLFRLTKAMPDQTNMPDLLLQLSRVAREAGIQFDSVTPQPGAAATGYTSVPVDLVFQGNFYELSDFLYRLRNLVGVHEGRLDAAGRLFSVNGIEFAEGESKFPQLQASLQVDAFVYGSASGPTASPTTETSTTAGSTTPAQTTTTPAATTPAATTPATTTPSSSTAALGAIP